MLATRWLLYTFCELFFDQTKNVYFRTKLKILQHVNKTSCHTKQYVQQGKCPLINIQNVFIYMFILVYIHDIVWMLKREQPELLTLPLSLLH